MWRKYSRVGQLLAALIASQGTASDYTWKQTAASRSWTSAGNWQGASGYPDDENDSATIPSDFTGTNYPLFDAASAITIQSFRVLNGAEGYDKIVLEVESPSSGSRVLKIKDSDGLDPGHGHIKLNKATELWRLGGGVMLVWGDLVFDSTGASESQRPQLVLGNGTALYVGFKDDPSIGSAFKAVGGLGGLIRGEVGQTPLDEFLILRPFLKGSFAVDVGLVALGGITTDDGDSDTTNTLRLSCLPKVAIGQANATEPAIKVVGHANRPGTLILDALTAVRSINTNSLLIDDYGVLKVNRHCTMPTDLVLEAGGRIEVKARALLSVGGPQPACAVVE